MLLISGKDVENVNDILNQLDTKKFLLSYIETTRTASGGKIKKKIEDYRKLINIVAVSQTEWDPSNVEIRKHEEIVVMLPIFRRQIDSKFILYPNDINKRTSIAYGSHNVSDAAIRLRDELIRRHASKIFTYEVGVERLYYMLCEKWMNEGRKKKVKEYVDRAIDMVTKLGVINSYDMESNSKGEPKIIFYINKDWLK